MNINLYIQIFLNIIRMLFLKLLHGERFSAHIIQRISFLTKFKISKNGQISLGKNICISKFGDFFVGSRGSLKIGDRVFFNRGVVLSCHNKIIIGNNCLFGPDIKIYDNNHKFYKEKGVSTSEHSLGEIIIGNNCWIGANVVILSSTKISDNCVIGAGAIVKGFIPENSLVIMDREINIIPIT